MEFDDLAAVLRALWKEKVEYVLVGGVAVGLQGLPRVTRDDFPVRVATPLTLYRMKKNTTRARDRADAEDLRARFGFKE